MICVFILTLILTWKMIPFSHVILILIYPPPWMQSNLSSCCINVFPVFPILDERSSNFYTATYIFSSRNLWMICISVYLYPGLWWYISMQLYCISTPHFSILFTQVRWIFQHSYSHQLYSLWGWIASEPHSYVKVSGVLCGVFPQGQGLIPHAMVTPLVFTLILMALKPSSPGQTDCLMEDSAGSEKDKGSLSLWSCGHSQGPDSIWRCHVTSIGNPGLHKIEIGLGTKFQDKFSAWFSCNFMLSGKAQNVHFILRVIYICVYIYRPKKKRITIAWIRKLSFDDLHEQWLLPEMSIEC